jgi:hypothetical protein
MLCPFIARPVRLGITASFVAIVFFGQRPTALAQDSHAAPPVPTRAGANGTRVTAVVLGRRVWPPGSLENVRPLLPATRTFYSLELKIETAEAVNNEVSNLEAGRTIDAFSAQTIPVELVGKIIKATITLTGDTEGVRWMLEQFEPIP